MPHAHPFTEDDDLEIEIEDARPAALGRDRADDRRWGLLTWPIELEARKVSRFIRAICNETPPALSTTSEAVAALPYLGAVCSETLRLNPIVPDIIRVLARPMTLKGYELPVGVGVCPAAALVHQRPELYPEPDRWRPERFLERSFGPSEYLPFGGGHRRCIGAAFAVYEMKLVLAVALRGHLLRLVKDGPIRPVRRNITMAPEGGVEMRYEGRRAE